MKNPKIMFVVFAVIFALCVVALLVYWVTKEPSEEPNGTDPTATETTTASPIRKAARTNRAEHPSRLPENNCPSG